MIIAPGWNLPLLYYPISLPLRIFMYLNLFRISTLNY